MIWQERLRSIDDPDFLPIQEEYIRIAETILDGSKDMWNPGIYPTCDGGVLLETMRGSEMFSIEIDHEGMFCHSLNIDTKQSSVVDSQELADVLAFIEEKMS